MKTIIALAATLFMSQAFASIDEINITSFRQIGDFNSPIAELCGLVKSTDEKLVHVVISSDPGKYQGQYSTLADSQGHFCSMIITQFGRAEVKAFSAISKDSTPISSLKVSTTLK